MGHLGFAALGQVIPGLQATGKPGEIFIPGVGVRRFADIRQDWIYDRVEHANAPPAGTIYTYFRDTQGKDDQDTSMTMQSRLPEGTEAVVFRVNIMPQANELYADHRLIIGGTIGKFILDENNVVMQGPCACFGSAYGLFGFEQTTTNLATVGVIANGVPSPGAQPRMVIPQYISTNRTFRFEIVYRTLTTLSAATFVYVILDVLITRPLR